jgi:hypothetical protein
VETWADRVVQAAWEHGYDTVEFVHGAADVAARGSIGHDDPDVEGRGTIKFILRQRLFRNRWRRWAEPFRDGNHTVEEGRMLIALLANPKPRPGAGWPVVPPPAYG